MPIDQRKATDIFDDVYTLAYWMTKSLEETHELFRKTYQKAGSDAAEIDVFKAFREAYFEMYEINESSRVEAASPIDQALFILRRQDADRKFSVLLSDTCGIRYRTIAKITGNPLSMIRLWLSNGRKWLLNSMIMLFSMINLDQNTKESLLLLPI
ncbi:MAG: RNA polymerase subunit sigma-24 [Prosthecochloris sp.]|uniref:RNA polymerase, sigma-24 subunit, ECF subfamily n=1 Tax=Prosthecochloris aestuarii (strain DSM 271 / SK 413) TaxID=290512 RepID=B4S7W6_PROA2|nr:MULTISPECIES: ECF subfamily RNA polymerase sigma-24 subunit [Prosthecochloris]ACF46153.1 RNA polymerase, sigma-24 subunit, ECF subfamily [Prosthecochloris aestuarii DSM 271]MCW8798632.1 RNA polymerase subunit sigma-24 [Prosthecochloris sp.]RDD30312.1 RNA polymerase subunit sigma-24 [Prosthecochloris sp. ZM]